MSFTSGSLASDSQVSQASCEIWCSVEPHEHSLSFSSLDEVAVTRIGKNRTCELTTKVPEEPALERDYSYGSEEHQSSQELCDPSCESGDEYGRNSYDDNDGLDGKEDENEPLRCNIFGAHNVVVQRSKIGVGLGLFAQHNIQKGQLLFQEKPLIRCIFEKQETEEATLSSMERVINEAVEKLPVVDRAAYSGLASKNGEPSPSWLDVYLFNAIPCDLDDLGRTRNVFGGAVFNLASRLNHSCRPNLHHCFDEENGLEMFFASREIQAGEELSIAYVDTLKRKLERQNELEKLFNFLCRCESCALEGMEQRDSDERRRLLCALDYKVYEAVETGRYDRAVALVRKRIELLEQEGLDNPKNLFRCEYDGYIACLNKGDVEGMKMWLKRACKHANEAFGYSSLTSCRLRMKEQELHFHAAVTNFMC